MLKGKNISNGFWVEVINIILYLKNMIPTKSLEFKTPFEFLLGFKPAVKTIKNFWIQSLFSCTKGG